VANLLYATTVSKLNYTNSYVYDLAGNRLWKTNFSSTGTQVTGYTNNANDQLVTKTNAAGSFTNKYDAKGFNVPVNRTPFNWQYPYFAMLISKYTKLFLRKVFQ